MKPKPEVVFVTARAVRERLSVSDMTIWRWLKDERLNFPHPVYINKRRYWRASDLQAWEAER